MLTTQWHGHCQGLLFHSKRLLCDCVFNARFEQVNVESSIFINEFKNPDVS